MHRKSKVLIVDNSPGVTGAYKSISALTAAIENDFDFIFCLPKGSSLFETSGKIRPTITLPFLELRKNFRVLFYLPVLLMNSMRLLRFINKNHIDILHINDLYNLVGVVIKLISPKIKVIYHVRLLPSSYSGVLYRFWTFLIKRYADYAICVSQAVKDKFEGENSFHSVISDAINPDKRFLSRAHRQHAHIHLLYIANYTPGKGQDDAIKAFSLAVQQNTDLRLTIAGDHFSLRKNITYKADLKRLAEQLEVANKIVFEEFVEDTSALFAEADIFLNFSKSESFSLTCLEALFHGLPVISTDSGGPAELFESGVSGLLVPVGDVAAMSRAIIMLSNNEAYRVGLAVRGKEDARERYNLCKSARRLKEVYSKTMLRSQ